MDMCVDRCLRDSRRPDLGCEQHAKVWREERGDPFRRAAERDASDMWKASRVTCYIMFTYAFKLEHASDMRKASRVTCYIKSTCTRVHLSLNTPRMSKASRVTCYIKSTFTRVHLSSNTPRMRKASSVTNGSGIST